MPWTPTPGSRVPSFFTGKESALRLQDNLTFKDAFNVLVFGEQRPILSTDLGMSQTDFISGVRSTIETVSGKMKKRQMSSVKGFVTEDCFSRLSEEMGKLVNADVNMLEIKDEDMFLHLIVDNQSKDDESVDVVSFSIKDLGECKDNIRKMEMWAQDMADLTARHGYIRREDFNAQNYEKLKTNLANVNIGTLIWHRDVTITTFRFTRLPSEGLWQIDEVGYLNTLDRWHWIQRFYWKSRIAASVHMKIEYQRFLRYDFLFDIFIILTFVLLQGMALYIGNKMDRQRQHAMQLQRT